ncbi:hypothetical protein ACFSJU_14920 [Paradesertivirga mongoliensis]|uniref:Phage protein n=1 Tax=Paradesertivirga mongoliensis TaxID=2100740 RepID=A0ABW4ZP46_9SPHI|nr:hypothetical protein [Pedobacter mongoliensis]
MTHKDLILPAYRWVLKNGSCGVAFKELNTIAGEYPDVIGFGSWGNSVLLECKATRSDFLCDKKKSFRKYPERGMGKYRYYVCPTGLIKKEELPDGWGLIYVDHKFKARCVYNPYNRYMGASGMQLGHPGFKQNLQAEHSLMYSALRRLYIKGHIDSIYDKEYVRDFEEDFTAKSEYTGPTLFKN